MSFFQKPAATPEEAERGRPLDTDPTTVATFDEDTWYQKVYRGDELPQLTLRAVAMGSVLGFFLSFTNLYIGLKTGWQLGVAITACILSFAVGRTMHSMGLARTQMSILENNCMQSTASAAGFSTGSAVVSAVPALLIMSASPNNPGGTHLAWYVLGLWTFFIAILGVVMAIPMKRTMINQERLQFPSGLAAATTLQSLFSKGDEALRKAKALAVAAVVGGILPVLMDLPIFPGRGDKGQKGPLLPAESNVFDGWLPAMGTNPKTHAPWLPSDWTMVLDHKLVMIAGGALVGMRTALSMLAGSLILIYWLGPIALADGATKAPGLAWREIGVWVGAPMMVASGLLSFGSQWRSIVGIFRKKKSPESSAVDEKIKRAVEVPQSWFFVGVVFAGLCLSWLGHVFFQIPFHMGLLAVALTYFLALVACRATGETDITPTGALGKIVQLSYGVLLPQNASANLMTASITGGAAGSSADLLTDLKSGYLLGANPRRQFIAQAMGILSGTVAAVAGFYLLVPDATALTGSADKAPAFAAPAAQAWLAVARVFQTGIEDLQPMARHGIQWGAIAGVALTVVDKILPAKIARYVPTATGIGLGFMLPFQYPFSMLIGAVIAWGWQNKRPKSAAIYVVALSSGVIAGESVCGVIVAAINNFLLGRS